MYVPSEGHKRMKTEVIPYRADCFSGSTVHTTNLKLSDEVYTWKAPESNPTSMMHEYQCIRGLNQGFPAEKRLLTPGVSGPVQAD